MSNQQSNENAMVLTARQEQLQRVRDNMAPGEKPAAIVPHTFAELIVMCDALAKADLAPKALRGKATDMALVIMTGAEVGLPPMAALRLYTTWDGVPRLMAEGMRAIILAHPECEWFRRVRGSDTEVVWSTKRRGQPEQTATWTIERARKAGLLSKDTWQKYPEDMLTARCSMQLARLEWPDVVAGMIAKEEAMDGDFVDAQAVEVKPQFVAPPPPQGPPPGVPQMATSETFVQATTNKPAEKPKADKKNGGKSNTPGTDPFRAAREAVDQRAADAAKPVATTADPDRAQTAAPVVVDAKTGEVTKDRWGQPVGGPADGPEPGERPTSAGGGPAPQSSEGSTSGPPSTASTESAADQADDGFGGGEDPADSQPPPTGDPGLTLIAEFQAFLAGCKTQQEMNAGSVPFRQRSAALFKEGDQRFAAPAAGKPAGELAGKMTTLWAERKAKLPV